MHRCLAFPLLRGVRVKEYVVTTHMDYDPLSASKISTSYFNRNIEMWDDVFWQNLKFAHTLTPLMCIIVIYIAQSPSGIYTFVL